MNEIRTSQPRWLEKLAKAYKEKQPVLLIDDADIGVDPNTDSIFDMGRKARISTADWMGVVVSLGIAAVGAYLLVMAILDPEPFSKISFAIGAGCLMTLGGGGMAYRVLTKIKPPEVVVTPPNGFAIRWN